MPAQATNVNGACIRSSGMWQSPHALCSACEADCLMPGTLWRHGPSRTLRRSIKFSKQKKPCGRSSAAGNCLAITQLVEYLLYALIPPPHPHLHQPSRGDRPVLAGCMRAVHLSRPIKGDSGDVCVRYLCGCLQGTTDAFARLSARELAECCHRAVMRSSGSSGRGTDVHS